MNALTGKMEQRNQELAANKEEHLQTKR